MTAVGGRAGHDSTKRLVERIGDGDDEANKTNAAPGGQQGQQKTEPQQRIKDVEDVIDHLGNSRSSTHASDLAFRFDNFANGLRAEVAGDLIDLLALSRGSFRRALSNLSLHFAFDLRLDRAVLSGSACFFHCQFVVAHIYSLVYQQTLSAI